MTTHMIYHPKYALGLIALFILLFFQAPTIDAQTSSQADWISRLRDEGTNRSQIAEVFGYLTDVIGPRLTGSPQCRRANDWTRDKLASWGLTNSHLEAWGPFGRGWSVKRFSAQVVEPQCIPLVAWPKAWSCGSEWPIISDVVYLDAKNEADLDKFKGKLKGCVVLVSSPRVLPIRYDAQATRLNETNLLRMANASPQRRSSIRPPPSGRQSPPTINPSPARTGLNSPSKTNEVRSGTATNQPSIRPPRVLDALSRLRFAAQEGAAVAVSVSTSGDGGILSVGDAMVFSTSEGTSARPTFMRAHATNAPAGVPQIVLAAEQYNRLVNMIQAGEKLKIAIEVQTQFHDKDPMCYNTIAEIPGSDLRDEIVMLGAHLDSAPGGTGASDNAAGVAVCMEAVRLIKTLQLKPRRTIRIGLWSGEEQGLLGSKAYVAQHFGYYTNVTNITINELGSGSKMQFTSTNRTSSAERKLVKHRDYKHFSAYYNLDNGAGKIRGIYLQSNEALRPLFREWLEPLRNMGAETITANNTGGTDHLSFDTIGLPGFQFIQDPVEYWRSYHTTIDVRERAPVEDIQQASIIMAAFVYNSAIAEEKLPRKTIEETVPLRR